MQYSDFDQFKIVGVRHKNNFIVIDVHKFLLSISKINYVSGGNILQDLENLEYDPVYEQSPPALNADQFAEWDGAILNEGKWYQNWKIGLNPNNESTKWADLRRDRNALLSGSDWTQGMDSPLSADMRQRWALYRQQLRDITKQDISAIVWPEPPTA